MESPTFPVVLQPDYVEKRENLYLMIWKDTPHWMVADREVLDTISLSDGTRSIQNIASAIQQSQSKGPSSHEVKALLKSLAKSGLIYPGVNHQHPPTEPHLENVTVNVTRSCNLRCTHCFVPDSNTISSTLKIADLKRFLQDGSSNISSNLNFAVLGGEPLLEKDKTLEIALLGLELEAEVIVSTNGLLIDDAFAQKAKELKLAVQVSLEGSTSELNDPIRGNGCFDRALKGVRTLVANETYSLISMVVTKNNLHDIPAFYILGRDLKVNEIRFIEMRRMGRALKEGIEPVPSAVLVKSIHKLLTDYPEARKYVMRDHFSVMKYLCARSNKRAYCGAGLKTVLIDADGQVYPCPNHAKPEFSCGNIAKQSFKEIWLDSTTLNHLRSTYHVDQINDTCSQCPVKYWCLAGCRGETYENTGDLRAVGTGCESLREGIIEVFWLLAAGEEVSTTRAEYF
ncbi:MAG: radical SAM protein [Candidatus Thorarchaeota archaeon]|nr:radical SAM protein [Candidatus Thorarchaeota archaeon]